MASGYTSPRSLGIPLAQRGHADPAGVPPPVPREAVSLAPRGVPFVFVRVDEVEVPGVVVEQRRCAGGWEALVALTESGPDGSGSLAVRWFDARRVRPAAQRSDA